MERLLIKLKEPDNREHIKFLKDAISNTLDRVGMKNKYQVWSHKDMQDTTKEVSPSPLLIFPAGRIHPRNNFQCGHCDNDVHLLLLAV